MPYFQIDAIQSVEPLHIEPYRYQNDLSNDANDVTNSLLFSFATLFLISYPVRTVVVESVGVFHPYRWPQTIHYMTFSKGC